MNETEKEWIKANAQGGWINDLRLELKTIREALIAYRSEMESPVKDPIMIQRRRRQLFSLVP